MTIKGSNIKAYVVQYRKGKEYPYGLSKTRGSATVRSFDDGNGLHKWFSVNGIKRYQSTGSNNQQETAQTPVKGLSASDVRQIVREEVEEATKAVIGRVAELHQCMDLNSGIIAEAVGSVNRKLTQNKTNPDA